MAENFEDYKEHELQLESLRKRNYKYHLFWLFNITFGLAQLDPL